MLTDNYGYQWGLFHHHLSLLLEHKAQATGEINGTVTDPAGAVVPGATITVTNPNTNIERTTQTNSSGVYSIPALPPGEYSLKASMAAFGTQIRNNITLQVNQEARIDIALQVGNVAEVVEVQGGAPVLETESTAIGTVIENQRIVELPLNGRNYLQLASLIPGANASGAFSAVTNQRQGGTRSQFNISISGNRIFYNHYMLDGIENSDPNFNSYIFLPSLDALQEFKVETGIPSAEFGRNMNQINVTTKSGTNAIHGAAFEFLRNAKLDAKNYFDLKTAPIPKFLVGPAGHLRSLHEGSQRRWNRGGLVYAVPKQYYYAHPRKLDFKSLYIEMGSGPHPTRIGQQRYQHRGATY